MDLSPVHQIGEIAPPLMLSPLPLTVNVPLHLLLKLFARLLIISHQHLHTQHPHDLVAMNPERVTPLDAVVSHPDRVTHVPLV